MRRSAYMRWAVMGACCSALASTAAANNPNWGFNFWAPDYFTGDAVFVDAGRTLYYANDRSENSPKTNQGIPIGGELFTMLKGYTTGVYTLSYEGQASVSVRGMGRLESGSQRQQGGRTYADIQIDNIDGFLYLEFDNVSSSDPIRNLRLTSPGYDPDTQQVVRNEFAERVAPFSTVRFMDYNRTNSSDATVWSARRQPDYLIQTIGFRSPTPAGGMTHEHMIDIVNDLDKDIWVNIPHLADDDYVRQYAELLRDRLEPDRKVIVEFSNELWNFSQGPELGKHMIDPNWTWSHPTTLYYGAVAPRVKEVSDIFHDVFQSEPESKLEIVLAGQNQNSWHVQKALEWFEDNGIDPSEVIGAISSAPYFSAANVRDDYTNIDDLMTDLVDQSDKFARRGIQRHKALADQYGLKLYAYEGGQHVWYSWIENDDLLDKAQTDPRMAEAYRRYIQMWEDENPGGLFMHYTLASSSWGLLKDMDQPGSYKWDTVIDALVPDGDITLDGKVSYEDFARLREHFRNQQLWREQGDLTGDRVVNADDWNELVVNLRGLTPGQLAELQAFARQNALPIPVAEPKSATAILSLLGLGSVWTRVDRSWMSPK